MRTKVLCAYRETPTGQEQTCELKETTLDKRMDAIEQFFGASQFSTQADRKYHARRTSAHRNM